ncbi:MAG TPA: 30S ribosomal protein S8 [Candidatus Polarisedimenticolia bacterium]|nr:30S ribosomal protein S8 [Candidatus Polarisedimenticolia bacterium]
MNDPIADMLTRIRNASSAGHKRVDVPHSRIKEAMAGILKSEGYIDDSNTVEKGDFRFLRIRLRYDDQGVSFITGLSRVSRPGKRVYTGHRGVPRVMGGLGLTILSTPRGLMSGRDARKNGVGGEILCSIW